jgi:hypothetical protein
VSAEDLRYSDIEKRLTSTSTKASDAKGVQAVALLSHAQSVETQPPLELGEHRDPIVSEPMPETCATGEKCTSCESGTGTCCDSRMSGLYYTEVELMWLRSHMLESSIGKLSEKYELSPRFIAGYETPGGVGGRVRYWTYGRWTPNLDGGDAIRFEMDVIDIEATTRFRTSRTDLVLAGGMRWADLEIVLGDDAVDTQMPGFTVAADLRTKLCGDCCQECALIGGARWSTLGGDWEGDSGGFLNPVRDDNIIVQELHGGVEYIRSYGNYDVFGRVTFEVQNWHSDAAAQDAAVDSFGFVGPGIELGMMF